MIEITNATQYIRYDPLKGNLNPWCSPKHPRLYKLTPANPYKRGRNTIERCNGGDSSDNDEKVVVDDNASSSSTMGRDGEPSLNWRV